MSISKVVMSGILAAGFIVVGINGAFAATAPDATTPAVSPAADHEGMDAEKAAKHMQKELGLTDDQTDKVKTIIQDTRQEGEKIRAELKDLHDKMQTELKGVLSDEQFKKWESKQSKRQSRMMKKS